MTGPAARFSTGFVLAGGQSSRMGRDKAMLEVGGETLLVRTARLAAEAAGGAAIIGPPARYGHLGYEVIADRIAGRGPLGGIDTALSLGRAEWNLVVACDLPSLSAELLAGLLDRARHSCAVCVLARSDRPEPLCAVYSLRAAGAIREALGRGVRKVTAGLEGLEVEWVEAGGAAALTNVNTPHDWEAFLG